MSKGIFAVCVAALLCWASEAAADSITEGSGTPDLKLLFVGNSLIYFNGGVHKVTGSPHWTKGSRACTFGGRLPYLAPSQPVLSSASHTLGESCNYCSACGSMASTAAIIKHRTSGEVVAKLMYAQLHAHAATWYEERSNGCTQVVAGLLHDEFPSAIIKADQVAGPNYLFTQHLDNAQKPGTAQWETLGPNSTDHWDFVLFQVRSLTREACYCLTEACSHKSLTSEQLAYIEKQSRA